MKNRKIIWSLRWLFFILTFGYLIPNHYSPWLSFHQEFLAFLAFIPVMMFGAFSVKVKGSVKFLLAASLIPLGQYALGKIDYLSDAMVVCIYLVGSALCIHAGAALGQDSAGGGVRRKAIDSLLGIFLTAGVFSVGIALYQWLQIGDNLYVAPLPPGWRPFANLAQPNHLGLLLVLAQLALLHFYFQRSVATTFTVVGLLLLVFGSAMTGSRAALLSVFVSLFMYANSFRKRSLGQNGLIVLFFAAFSGMVYFLLWPSINGWGGGDIENTVLGRSNTVTIRIAIIQFFAMEIPGVFFDGVGWGQITHAQYDGALSHPAMHAIFDSSHNFLLDLFLWNGVPIGLIFLGLIGWAAFRLYRVRNCELNEVLVACIGAIFIHTMFEYPLYYSYFLLPAAFMLGLTFFSEVGVIKQKVKSLTGIGAVIFIVLVGGRVAWEYMWIEADWRLMQYQEAKIAGTPSMIHVGIFFLDGPASYIRASRVNFSTEISTEEIEAMEKTTRRYPYAAALYRLAVAYRSRAEPEKSRATLERLCLMHDKKTCASALKEWAIESPKSQLD